MVCDDCLAEMRDPADRRYRYPFINCTNCGPRYTIIDDIPYDRPKTSMRHFTMCPDCQAEYDDPDNRRFHAQPNACPVCGPQVTLCDAKGIPIDTDDPIAAAARRIRAGRIVAVKGLGGFHLAVDAVNEAAVVRLRRRKHREEKPLALMCASIGAHIRSLARVNPGGRTAASLHPAADRAAREKGRHPHRRIGGPQKPLASASCCPIRRCTICCWTPGSPPW